MDITERKKRGSLVMKSALRSNMLTLRTQLRSFTANTKNALMVFQGGVSLTPPSGVQEGYVYNIRGVFEICRWSKQPKANMVMDALYGMAESVARTGFYSILPDQELIDLLVKRQSENPTFLREAAVDLKSKKALDSLESCGNREPNSLSVSTRVNSMLSVTATSPFSARKSRNTRNGTPLLRLAR